MPTLLMCPGGAYASTLTDWDDVPEGSLRDRWGREPHRLSPRVPYLLGSDFGGDESGICGMLDPHGGLLCDLCQDFGGPTTVALAEISADLRRYASEGLGAAGAVSDTYRARVARFAGAMQRHQEAVAAYHRATRAGAPGNPSRAAAREALQRSGAELNQQFHRELELSTRGWYPRSRMVVSGGAQVPDRVRNTPKLSRLDVRSQTQASALVQLAQGAKYVNRGVVVIDAGMRIQRVQETADSGEDWHRQAAIESAGFVGAVLGGSMGTAIGGAALGAVMAMTPAGWVVIVAGVAAAGITLTGTKTVGTAAELLVGGAYDSIRQFQEGRP